MFAGEIHFTGFEDSGTCWWCGGELKGRQRRYCCESHMYQYWETWNWHLASLACIRRYERRCANCYRKENYRWREEQVSLEVHHIIPLNGEERSWHELNRPDNLICLCHECHLLVHEAMREPKKPADPEAMREPKKPADPWEKARLIGQGILELAQQK